MENRISEITMRFGPRPSDTRSMENEDFDAQQLRCTVQVFGWLCPPPPNVDSNALLVY